MKKRRDRATTPSSTPLVKKLGFKEDARVYIKNAPSNYHDLIMPVPSGVVFLKRLSQNIDLIHLFITSRQELADSLPTCVSRIKSNGMIWVSWPKKASGVPTDVTEHVIRTLALPLGVVDIKVCAVDSVWSGLKLVVRKENRPEASAYTRKRTKGETRKSP